jgi:hypothetical protein
MLQSIEELINDKLNKLHKIHIAKAMPKAFAT